MMKKVLLSVAGILVLTGAGLGYAAQSNETYTYEKEPMVAGQHWMTDLTEIEQLVEYETLNESLSLENYVPQIVEDHSEKRVILLKNQHGEPRYKSIYLKNTNQLKVVDFNSGIVLDQMIQEDENIDYESVMPVDFAEHEMLTKQLPMDTLKIAVIEDNQQKRVLVLKEGTQERYKSIYIKSKNRLKIVDFRQGLVFDQVLSEDVKETPQVEVPKVETPKEEIPKEETPKQEAPKVETPKQEAPKAEAPKQETPKPQANSGISGLAEYGKLSSYVNVGSYNAQIVEDNQGKRIIVLKDQNEKQQYKSIYVKKKGFLKIISMGGGLVYNGSL